MSFKRRGVTGGYDSDSDDDVELNISVAASGSQATRTFYEAVPAKRPRIASPAATDVTALPPCASDALAAPEAPPKAARKQGASVMMDIFSKHFDVLQAAILSTEYHRHIGSSCPCGKALSTFRCTECFQSELFCQDCIVAQHRNHPLHFLQEWTGTFFRRAHLVDLGFMLTLGHGGDPCPNGLSTSKGRPTVIVHINGIHKANIKYCHCDSLSEPDQLARERLFPATIEQPETAFTFAVLKHFHISNLTSKISAYDYFGSLRSLTNNAFPQEVPDRYREFNRVSRVWSHLAIVRRSGQAHKIDIILTHRRPGSLTVRCPACPEVGFNVEEASIIAASSNETHKYTLFLSIDGNFRLQRKNKNDDPDDVALNDGNGYFVPMLQFKTYLRRVGITIDEEPTCPHLRAARMQNIVKFKNAAGVVDLTKGEAFPNTDFAVAYALSEAKLQRWIMISYDIWCQYHVNLRKRFNKWFPGMAWIIDKIRGAIPKMHIVNHILACMLLFAFNYIRYSGETWGENIEGGWAEQNQSAGSTKEQNDGHRHDSLDDFFGYWNWTKLHQIGKTLNRMYSACIKTLKTREDDFAELTSMHSPEVIARWEAMDTTPRKVNGVVTSVYEVQLKNGPPTLNRAYQTLVQEEIASRLADGEATGSEASFINIGLQLEDKQAHLTSKAKSAQPGILSNSRAKLNQEITNWRQEQLSRFPSLHSEQKSADGSHAEELPLLLPSSFSTDRRSILGLNRLAQIEYQLREGQAHDALAEVRLAIKTCNANLQFKRNQVHGQRPNTRAQQYLRTLEAEKLAALEKYQRAYRALLALGLSPEDQSLRPLDKTQLWMKNVTERHQMGHSKTQDPWFWHAGRPSGLSPEEEDAWSLEMDRVKWFRDRAARDRSREEKEILEEEFRRSVTSFQRMSQVWTELAKDAKESRVGYGAYGYRQAAMYGKLADDCNTIWQNAIKATNNEGRSTT
ncbi:hypothetical protein LshimejAT787_0109760 [Lyophyllum shimeji]|uniref:CxC2-like cysteine cluster KDZ transposase-associated domain-containing protein n=1 Tax=Lyophyllum shimeji TaxID=47721 RepID=A0A9P3UIE6_LYOSH|nr:hypothetical protein LshimejAT787_0109760 [Lyophyllum shimeji]